MSAGPPPLPRDPSYEARLTYFEKQRIYRIRQGVFQIEEDGQIQQIALNQINQIRCRFFPTRYQLDRYEAILTVANGLEIKIGNQIFLGFAEFEDRSPDFRSFIIALHKARLALDPPCRFIAGVTTFSFWLNAIFLGSVLLLLIGLIIFFATTIPWVALVKAGLLALMLPVAINWFRKNRPREYDGHHIPEDILPKLEPQKTPPSP